MIRAWHAACNKGAASGVARRSVPESGGGRWNWPPTPNPLGMDATLTILGQDVPGSIRGSAGSPGGVSPGGGRPGPARSARPACAGAAAFGKRSFADGRVAGSGGQLRFSTGHRVEGRDHPMRGLTISGSALQPALTLQQVLANNLANASVPGFRADRGAFHRVLAGEASGPDVMTRLSRQTGPLEQTGEPLHLALVGRGYFAVETPEGERYTRSGAFIVGNDGTVQTRSGAVLQTEAGPLAVSAAGDLVVEPGGRVVVAGQPAGRLRLVDFNDPGALRHVGEGLLAADGEPQEAGKIEVLQGRLEGSNVSSLHTMTEMITLLRFVEANQKAFQAQDGSLEGLIRWALR
ncbi:MAG: flagellar hook-basal body complex protein [Candidatus Eisenbacteria bacterium]|nr:flagellar hook-basal body complex protein [Candidatus Eisenbacteria bacterium]